MAQKSITREDALWWLNDRLGQPIDVDVRVDAGEYSIVVLSASGELRHWTENAEVGHWDQIHIGASGSGGETNEDAALHETLRGMYGVGADAHLDISDDQLSGFALRETNLPGGVTAEQLVVSVGDVAELVLGPTTKLSLSSGGDA